MSRLIIRHPIRAAREPFGKAGLIVAIVALVAAIGGTALAASGLNSKQKKEVTKIAKKYAGAGPAGAQGPAGAAGPAGPAGAKGETGAAGGEGKAGESVKVAESANAFGTHCNNTTTGKGGSEFKVGAGTPVYACNGKEGAAGVIHPGPTPGEANPLPSEATETGAWSFGVIPALPGGSNAINVPISFPVPLPAPLGEPATHFVEPGHGETEDCPGTVAEPKAKPGNLCVYVGFITEAHGSEILNPGAESPFEEGAGTTGAVLSFGLSAVEAKGQGTWAVTAE